MCKTHCFFVDICVRYFHKAGEKHWIKKTGILFSNAIFVMEENRSNRSASTEYVVMKQLVTILKNIEDNAWIALAIAITTKKYRAKN